MKKTLIVCDCCGEEVTGEAFHVIVIGQEEYQKIPKKLRENTTMLFEDVHADCLPAIKELFNPAPVEKRENTGRHSTIDSKEVMARRNAGWTIPQIASDLKCSKSAVGRIIQIEKEAAL